jgi:hypothetical protein
MRNLTLKEIDSPLVPGMHGDGDGLHLHIKPSGAKRGVFRYPFAGARREMASARWPR